MTPAPAVHKVADRIAATLHAHGVRHAFGIPGNDVLELIRACSDAGIAFTLAKNEVGAAFMAEAVTQTTGAPAACIFALGPGIANGLAGIAGAVQERAPIIVLGGEMAGNRRAIYNHQVFDHVAAMTPVTKYAAELNPERAAQQTARALDIAMTHPHGPVFLNCPADATRSVSSERATAFRPAMIAPGVPDEGVMADCRGVIARAKRPLALVGRGAIDGEAPRALNSFLDATRLPFFATYKAKGVLPETHPLCLGAVALSPVFDERALSLIKQADALVLVGFDPIELRDAWLDAWEPSTAVVSIDTHVQSHRIFPVGVQLIGDVAQILRSLTPTTAHETERWPAQEISRHRQAVAALARPREPRARISPAALFHAVSRRVTAKHVMTVDVGAHRILANHVLACHTPGQLLQSNGLGHMGYAIPAAIGASIATGRTSIAMLGDGCALMSLGELAVVAERQLPIVTVVLVDDDLALIDLKQDKMKMRREAVGFRSPDFAAIARGFGIAATPVADLAAFDAALEAALAAGQPHLIAAQVDPAEYWDQM